MSALGIFAHCLGRGIPENRNKIANYHIKDNKTTTTKIEKHQSVYKRR